MSEMASYFQSASGFNINSLKVDNVDGDYTDERSTVIDKDEVRRATYDQEGAVGVVNDRGRFRGKINYTGGPPASRRTKDQPVRSQTAPNAFREEQFCTNHGDEQDLNIEPASRPPRSDTKRSSATYFKDAADFNIDAMDIKNTTGNRVDRGTTHVHKKLTHEKYYNQRGAVGVVNGSGRMAATINYGGKSKSSKTSRQDSESEDEGAESEEESSSEDDREYDHRRGNKYIQKDAVGVVNDRGRFKGTINYNTQSVGKGTKAVERRRRKAYTYDSRAEFEVPEPASRGQREFKHETPPSIGIHPSSPPQGPNQDTGGIHGLGLGNSFQQQQSPRTTWLDSVPEYRSPQQQPAGYSAYRQQAPPTGLLSPLGLGLHTPPPTPGQPVQNGTPEQWGKQAFMQPSQVYVDKNPFRRHMAAQAVGQDLNGIANGMNKMHVSLQAAYPSPDPSEYYGSPGNAPQYF